MSHKWTECWTFSLDCAHMAHKVKGLRLCLGWTQQVV